MHTLPLAPRYRLDDEQPWLVGIDPIRRYWLAVNGNDAVTLAIPGLVVSSVSELRDIILTFRGMTPGEQLKLPTFGEDALVIHCVGDNCFAVEGVVQSAPTSHLFDQETLESLLRTAHPDWQCAPAHLDLGKRFLSLAWQEPAAVKAA